MGIAHLDGEKLFAALDAQRIAQELTWKQVAGQAGVSPSTLTRMSQGRRPDVDSLAALCSWAGLDTDEYYVVDGRPGVQEPLANVVGYLRADRNLTPDAAEAIERLMKTAYDTLRKKA